MGFAPPGLRRPQLPIIDTTKLRVAYLDASSGLAGGRHFAPERWSGLETFSPNVLAGSVAQLQRLLDRITLQTVNAASVDHSVFVITQLGDPPLTPAFRDQLWFRFSVPVYEVYVDEQAGLLAFECEAQEGWHVNKGVRFVSEYGELLLARAGRMVRTGLKWRTEDTLCSCGRESMRLMESGGLTIAEPLLATA